MLEKLNLEFVHFSVGQGHAHHALFSLMKYVNLFFYMVLLLVACLLFSYIGLKFGKSGMYPCPENITLELCVYYESKKS